MEIPGWFGVTEFYAVLVTVWFALIIYFLVAIVRTKEVIKVKDTVAKIKQWWKDRKKRKEEKSYERVY